MFNSFIQEVQPLVSNSVEAISEGKSTPHFNMNIHPYFLLRQQKRASDQESGDSSLGTRTLM